MRRQIRNARERDHMINNSIAPPGKGWILVARRRIASGGQVYNAGCEISPTAAGRNIRALLDSGAVWWAPPGTPIAAKPVKLPAPAKLQPLPTLEFIDISRNGKTKRLYSFEIDQQLETRRLLDG